jgi:DNA-binding response OmpR family regulator
VCLAEDDEDIRMFMALVLERAGFETEAYDNGVDVLSAALRSPADAYIVDRRMPGMDGLELCRQLRAHPPTERTAIVLVSAETMDLAMVAADAGADAYLPKPFSRAELVEKIQNLVGPPRP